MAKPRRQRSLLECSKWTEEDSAEGNESVALAKKRLELVGLGYQLTFPSHVEMEAFTDCIFSWSFSSYLDGLSRSTATTFWFHFCDLHGLD